MSLTYITEFKMIKYSSRNRWLIITISDDMKGKIIINVLENHSTISLARKRLHLIKTLANNLRGDINKIMENLDKVGAQFRPKISK